MLDFKFKQLAAVEWEDSDLYDLLTSTQYLLVVFKETTRGIVFVGCQLWHMDMKTLETVRKGWEAVKAVVNRGVVFRAERTGAGGEIVHNNLPGASQNDVFHIRPHASKTYYIFKDGSRHGKGSLSDCDQLPDGQWMTKHAYWLNKDYIVRILDKEKVPYHKY